MCRELNLFAYLKNGSDYYVSEVADEERQKKIRDILALNVVMQTIPNIRLAEVCKKEHLVILEHEFEERELQHDYARP